MAIKNHTYRNHMTVLNRIMKKGYSFEEADVLTRNVFSNYGDGKGLSIEALTDRILTKEEYINQYGETPAEEPSAEVKEAEEVLNYWQNHSFSAEWHREDGKYILSGDGFCEEFDTIEEAKESALFDIREWEKMDAEEAAEASSAYVHRARA